MDVNLSKDEVQQIRKACEEADVGGERYAPQLMAQCYADTPELK